MAFLDFLFGSSEQKQELPKWYEDAAQANIGRAQDIAEMGYMPYYGVDVAGFTPGQQAAMQNTNTMAQQYGLNVPQQTSQYNMVTDPVTGIQGFRSGDIFDQARNELKQRAPAQYDYYNSMVIDPVTGNYGSRTRGGEVMGLLSQMGADTSGLNAGSSSSDYENAMQGVDYNFNREKLAALLANIPPIGPIAGLLSALGSNLQDKYQKEMQQTWADTGGTYMPSSNASRQSSALDSSGETWGAPTVGSGGGNVSRGYSTGGW